MPSKKVHILLNIHTLPEDLKEGLLHPKHYLHETAQIYQKLVDSDLLFPIWAIDEYQRYWLAVNFMNTKKIPEFHTLAIDEGTYTTIPFETYEIEILS